ncbi:MAG: hypothetical protein QF486_03585 [Candidatus Woesearchaeota archaeon]|jgi:hypothetical protein|nr:hypothetical protein [Candidatus Woesearchaeota archaeon]MDP7198678.1 hypothetical protein [Candidatus Woesearchaeota archaeon]MDP7467652.1 hypothetical protein [Candidatus Woesearchaeota archaeon]MDP7647130.1 hypothetical protein [Candidatus Woesearchaeota archaeon]
MRIKGVSKFWKELVLSWLLDLVMFGSLIYLNVALLVRLGPYFTNALQLIQDASEKAAREEIPNLNALLTNNQMFMNNFKVIVTGILLAAVILLVIWIITQTINWVLAYKITKKKKVWWKFALQTLASFLLLLIANLLAASIFQNANSIMPTIGTGTAIFLTALIFLVWSLITTAILVFPKLKDIKIKGSWVKYWVGITAVKIILVLDVFWLSRYNGTAAAIFCVVILFPFITYGRLVTSLASK